MNPLSRLYLSARGSGWFTPGAPGTLFPFPVAWQAWVMFGGLLVGIVGSIFLPDELGWICRISLCVGYIGIGMLSYDRS